MTVVIRRLSTALATLALSVAAINAFAIPISGQGSWETSLLARDINGAGVALGDASAAFYYDTRQDITWLADWNAGAGSIYDNGSSATDGRMSWNNAMLWASNLTVGAFDDWRLPALRGEVGSGYNITTYSEMGHLFFETLGNLAYCDTAGNCPQPGRGLTNTAEFLNMQHFVYWSNYAQTPSNPWGFYTTLGFQGDASAFGQVYAVAVRRGDVLAVTSVPEPNSLMLLLLGGLGVLGLRRR